MEIIADELAEKAKLEEKRAIKRQAEAEKRRRLEEERAFRAALETKLQEKEIERSAKKQRDNGKKLTAAKQNPAELKAKEISNKQQQLPPRFLQKQKMQSLKSQKGASIESSQHQNQESQEIGTWQNPEGAVAGNNWGNGGAANNDIIVDTQDKEAWPSIGDQSETASDGDTDNAVKSGSVINSSSNPGQGQGQVADMSGQGTSAIKGQSASRVWGPGFTSTGEENCDSNMTWGTNPVAGQISSTGWGNPPPSQTSSVNNQGHNMQMSQSGGSIEASSSLTSSSPGPSSALGWDNDHAMVGGAGTPTSSAGRAVIGSSGAQTVPSSQAQGSMATNTSMAWPLPSLAPGLSGSQKQQSNTDSTWENGSAGSSVIGQGLGISTSAAAPNSMDTRSTASDHWGGNPAGGASGWGSADSVSGYGGRGDSGWGSPPPSSPLPNAGTEGWGQPDAIQTPRNSWGQQPDSKMAGGDAGSSGTSGWGNNSQPPNINPGGWNTDSRPPSAGWGGEAEGRGNPSSGWGGQTTNTSSASSVWNTSTVRPPSNSQWNQGPGPSGAGAANPQQAPGWGGANNGSGAASSNPQGNNPAWGGGAPARPGLPGQPPPPQSQPHPNQAQGSGSASPQNQYSSSPSTWAQAVGGNKNNYGNRPPPIPPPTPMTPKDEYVIKAISSNAGWGKRPIRQDTSWDVAELETRREPPPRRGSNSSSGSGEGGNWNAPNNNGTAIWESAAKENTSSNWDAGRGHSRSGSASSGPEWGSDNDSGHWNGPPNQNNTNTWGGPPPPHPQNSNQWQGGNDSNTWQEPNKPAGQWGANSQGNSNNNQWQGGNQWGGNGPKEDNVWDRNGTQAWGSSSSGGSGSSGKMEMGTWEGGMSGRGSSGSSWGGDDNEPSGWEEPSPPTQRRQNPEIDDGTALWGNPEVHRRPNPSWNPQGGPPPPHGPHPPHMQMPMPGAGHNRQPSDDRGISMWGQSSQPTQPSNSGWGDPNASVGKSDDGTGYWGGGPPPPQGGGSWGDNNWGPGGGAKPKTPTMGWDATAKKGANSYNMGGKPHPPQMRSKLLHQLMDMGFKKEDAQKALITNNMNLESAIAELLGTAAPGGKRLEEDKGHKLRPGDDVLDAQSDVNQFVPPISMQNTPYSNAQLPMANSQVMPSGMLPPGVPPISSRGNLGQSSINPPQQKILAHPPLAQTPGQIPPQGPALRSQLSAQSMHQQAMQQQIVQQLQLAVRAGLISPQLLNQQLTPNMLVMLQNLLQLQSMLQRLVAGQQVLQQPKPPMNLNQRQSLEKTAHMIPQIKQQIYQLQQQIAAAQQTLPKQPPVTPTDPVAKDIKEINAGLAGLSLGIQQPAQQQQQLQQQQKSRLTQWTRPSEDSGSGGEGGPNNLNKAVGSKPISQSHSTPNLQNKETGSSGLPFSDSTWSNSTSTDWPSTSSTATPTSATAPDTKDCTSSNDKEGETAIVQASTTSTSSTPSASTPTSQTLTSDTETPNSSAAPGVNINDMIEEFIPGKPWQGITTKSVEEDPNMTPGSVSRPSLSVNTIKDDYLTSTLGKSSPSVTAESSSLTSSTWSFGGSSFKTPPSLSGDSKSTWSSNSSLNEGQSAGIGSQLWGVGVPGSGSSKSTRPPPGLTNQNKPWTRSVSWTPGDRSSYGSSMTSNMVAGGWGGQAVSNCLVLKNLTPQIDGSTLRTLCVQHGPLLAFYLNQAAGQALVRYNTKEEAIKAQKSLNACLLGNTTILAEFVGDTEASRLLEQLTPHAPVSASPTMTSSPLSNLWSNQAGYNYRSGAGGSGGGVVAGSGGSGGSSQTPFLPTPSKGDGNWNGASGFSGGGGMWGSSDLWSPNLEYNTLLPGDLLGGQSM